MNRPRNKQPQVIAALAQALKRRNPDWNDSTVRAEQNREPRGAALASGAGKRAAILIDHPHGQPVAVVAEFAPAYPVEGDAAARLGKTVQPSGSEIEGALTVALPQSLRTGDLDRVESAAFCYAAYSLDSRGHSRRWPPGREWLVGGVDDLADAIEHLSLSERRLARGMEALYRVVRYASAQLGHSAGKSSLKEIAKVLHQEAGEQTRRMAAAVWVSSFVFHAAIETQNHIPPVPKPPLLHKGTLLNTWNKILDVNYWPIFSIARELLEKVPPHAVYQIMDYVAISIARFSDLGATNYRDFAGRLFQALITDCKFIAVPHTLPASASLLAELAVERLEVDWSDKAAIEELRIADFACGTGALLSAAQRAVCRRFRRAGGNDKNLHQALMQRVLTGMDIMPAATHLTCSILSSAHPGLPHRKSPIHTMPYGIHGTRTRAGALDLLNSHRYLSLFAADESVTVIDETYDLVIMNPPFTRPASQVSRRADAPSPFFAGFGAPGSERRALSQMLAGSKPEFGHGDAGLASNFMDLGHRKLRDGGVLALVLPYSFARGKAWERARDALEASYSDIHVLTFAAVGATAGAFSADSEVAECLVVATKRGGGGMRMTNLLRRPATLLEANLVARDAGRNASRTPTILSSFDGSLRDLSGLGVISEWVEIAAKGLAFGNIAFPGGNEQASIRVTRLGNVAKAGPAQEDIIRQSSSTAAPPRDAFDTHPSSGGTPPGYPALCGRDRDSERRLVVRPDSAGWMRPDMRRQAALTRDRTASRLHANPDFRLNSQSLSMCLTAEKCLGGRAWLNVMARESDYEIPLVLWCNSTLGLILFWWHGSRLHLGRSSLAAAALPDLPVLDVRALKKEQVNQCRAIFEDLQDREFLPASEALHDETRKALDRALLFGSSSVLQLDPKLEEGLGVLRDLWCAEPSVNGGKPT